MKVETRLMKPAGGAENKRQRNRRQHVEKKTEEINTEGRSEAKVGWAGVGAPAGGAQF